MDDDDFNGDGEYNSLDEAYWEGYDDGYNDDDNMIDMEGYSEANPDSPYIEHDNPYEPGTIEHLMWEGGHREGSRDCEGGY
ncbi:hypothetical protein [Flavobacterium sp.]|uniref:hypothetical protein n=1 Tax=Flavobacterium sp. TaxID=239 RepID=UPI00374D9069